MEFTKKILDSKASEVDFVQVVQFLDAHPYAVRAKALLIKAEESLEQKVHHEAKVCRWFKSHDPQTPIGYRARGFYCAKQNDSFVLDGWIFGSFDKKQMHDYLAKHDLSSTQHLQRINQLLITKKSREAHDMLELIPSEYRKGVLLTLDFINNPKKVDIARTFGSVPKKHRVPALILYYLQSDKNLERIKRDLHLFDEAFDNPLYLQNKAEQGNVWAKERIKYARRLLLQHQYRSAYKLVSRYSNVSDMNIRKIEWLAGWIQLRFLHSPKKALNHFFVAQEKSSNASDLAKQAYWIARSFDKLGQRADAAKYYNIATQYGHTFYGQIAHETLKRSLAISFANLYNPHRPSGLAYQRLIDVLDWAVANKKCDWINYCVSQIIEKATNKDSTSNDDVLQNKNVVLYALSKAQPHLPTSDLTRLAEVAAQRNIVLHLAYPTPYPKVKKYVDEPLTYAIIKQESCFNPTIVGSSGDIGLMQINPKYLSDFAKVCNVPASKRSLYRPEYSIALGTMQLSKLVTKYNNYPALIACAYNAGARRTDEWIKMIGDPRKKDLYGRVDWFESIVYPATMNYAQTITATVNVYQYLQR
ncbi:transglycosylase SLT domain-containing protein [Candidatus Sarmatiella mevalonica]|uniref:transglycosylase SLT domain-containing protein n=1 Tax=Candidatus Sarmatiella mevalonica TaxID=2770581 RepID=UPI0019212CB8